MMRLKTINVFMMTTLLWRYLQMVVCYGLDYIWDTKSGGAVVEILEFRSLLHKSFSGHLRMLV